MVKINNTEKCIEFLDRKKKKIRADIYTKNHEDFTALHFAVINGNDILVNSLLYHGAIIDAVNKYEMTPLIYSC